MTDLRLSVTWDTYQKNICNGLGLLQQRGEFVDMTIAADGHHVKVHQMIMSLVSPFIKELISSAQCPHPVIFLNRVSYQTLQLILEYVYTGEVMITRDKLEEFLEACRALAIKGLENETIQSSSDGALLRHVGKTDIYRPEQAVQTLKMEELIQTGPKRKKTNPPEVDNDETFHDNIDKIEDSQMEDCPFDGDDDYEEIVVPSQPDDSPPDENAVLAKSSQIQYSLSCQGSVQIILNRFIYHMRHTRKSNERMWRCADYNKSGCSAFVVTKGDKVVERGCAHNHAFHDKQILKRVRTGNMFTAYNTVETMAKINKKIPAT